ncbi:hypothetical protein QUF55_04855 [Clostridiaceae bacterium HSG29]|nr:hypothetical protein [Clostridiaceae bacterium HSG29]
MEKTIRQAGGCQDFEANIIYPNTKTQIPSSYNFVYYINENKIVDSFENGNPEKANEEMGIYANNSNVEDDLS